MPFRKQRLQKPSTKKHRQMDTGFRKVCAGQEVLKDALLGRWKSSDGTQNCEVRARFAGRVLYETTALGVRRNDPLVAYGTA